MNEETERYMATVSIVLNVPTNITLQADLDDEIMRQIREKLGGNFDTPGRQWYLEEYSRMDEDEEEEN